MQVESKATNLLSGKWMSKPGLLLLVSGNCLSLLSGMSETCASTFPCCVAGVDPPVELPVEPGVELLVVVVTPVAVVLPCRKCMPTMETMVMAAAALPPATRKVRTFLRGMGACLPVVKVDCALLSGASAGAGGAINGWRLLSDGAII